MGFQAPCQTVCEICRFFQTMHGGVSDPSFCVFIHRVAFEEVSGHRVLMNSGLGNRGRSAFGTTHVASLEFPHETGLILRCAGKVGNPFETKQWNRPSYRDQERRKASDEVVPETSVSPLVRSVYRGTFGVASRVPSTVLHFKTECETSLETL